MSLLGLYSSNVKRKKEELARLKKDRVKYVNDISNASQKITRLSSQMRNTKSVSTIKSKMNEIEREEKKKSDAEKKVADYDKRIATKEKELCNEELKLQKEQDRENRNIENTRNREIANINNKVEYQRLKQIELDNENNLKVFVNMSVKENAVIKELSTNLQNKIKEAIKKASDLEVKEVNIKVKNIEPVKENIAGV